MLAANTPSERNRHPDFLLAGRCDGAAYRIRCRSEWSAVRAAAWRVAMTQAGGGLRDGYDADCGRTICNCSEVFFQVAGAHFATYA